MLQHDTRSDNTDRHPAFATIEPDVEAILIKRNRVESRSYIAPIPHTHWSA